jgi:uncharacterized protein YbjT (DUF2867 family)
MILVTGATGNIGAEVVRVLLAEGQEQVRRLARDDTEAMVGVETAIGDLNKPESVRPALQGVRAVFLLPGFDDTGALLAEFKQAGVEHVVLLSGSSAESPNMANAVTRYMVLSERAVRESGLPWTILRPNAFMSNALRWLPQLQASDVVRLPFPTIPIATIDPYDIACVATVALLNPVHFGRTHRLTGPESLLPARQLSLLADAIGRDLRPYNMSDDEAREDLRRTMPDRYVDAFLDFYAGGSIDESTVHPTVPDLLGRSAMTFSEWATSHAHLFR